MGYTPLPYSTEQIDREEQLIDAELTYSNLRKKYGTFRTFSDGVDRLGKKKHKSRYGAQTDLGDIEISLWTKLVNVLIDRNNDREMFNNLKTWVLENYGWKPTKDELEKESLELMAAQIFDNPEWVSYVLFNEKYRPNVLKKANLVWVKNECCNKPHRVTKEILERLTIKSQV